MIAMLLWIVGCYGLAVVVVHLVHRLQNKLRGVKPAPWMHVVIVSHNDERHMEWIIRAYSWFAWIKGRRLQFSVVDNNSTDDTTAIISKMVHRNDMTCHVVHVNSKKEQEDAVHRLQMQKQPEEVQIVLMLHKQADWRRVPFVAGGAL
ncbi:glycosyltransferase family A protein [Paenibacillus marinisediminis]